MEDRISFFQYIYNVFWGDDIYRWWFYVAIILIFIFAKQKLAKRIFALYPLCFELAVFSPVAYYLIYRYSSGGRPYYSRMFSMLPLPETLALGTVLVIEWINSLITKRDINNELTEQRVHNRVNLGRLVKLNLTIGTCALIVFGGTDVYTQDWMQPAQNLEKVPNEAIWICKAVHRDECVTIAVPASISSYIRQVDAHILMPYSGISTALGYAISEPNPNPDYVMAEAGAEACDYIVVYNNVENKESFLGRGWSPYSEAGGYLIYEVKDVPRVKKSYDKKHREILQTTLDKDGKPEKNNEGYVSIAYEYNRFGNKTRECYLDENNTLVMLKDGYASINWTYIPYSNRKVSIIYRDTEERAVCFEGCFETRYEYDSHGWIIRMLYYDAAGKLMNRTDALYAIRELTRNEDGKIIKELYYDVDHMLTLSSDGYAGLERTWDKRDNVLSLYYLGIDAKPILIDKGYAGFYREYDDANNMIRETLVDIEGRVILCQDGYAERRREYNMNNQMTRETYWDEQGNPAFLADGYCGLIKEYDDHGNLINTVYLYGEEMKQNNQ